MSFVWCVWEWGMWYQYSSGLIGNIVRSFSRKVVRSAVLRVQDPRLLWQWGEFIPWDRKWIPLRDWRLILVSCLLPFLSDPLVSLWYQKPVPQVLTPGERNQCFESDTGIESDTDFWIHDGVYNGLLYINGDNVTYSWLTLAILCCLRRRYVCPVLATVA